VCLVVMVILGLKSSMRTKTEKHFLDYCQAPKRLQEDGRMKIKSSRPLAPESKQKIFPGTSNKSLIILKSVVATLQ